MENDAEGLTKSQGVIDGQPEEGGQTTIEKSEVDGQPEEGGQTTIEKSEVEGQPDDGGQVKSKEAEEKGEVYEGEPLLVIITEPEGKDSDSAIQSVTMHKVSESPSIAPSSELLSTHGLGTFSPKVNIMFMNENEPKNKRSRSIIADVLFTDDMPERRRASLKLSASSMRNSIFLRCLPDSNAITPRPKLRSSKRVPQRSHLDTSQNCSPSSSQKHVAKEPPKKENPLCTPGKTNADYFREHGKGIIPQYKPKPSSQALMLFKSYPTKNHMLEQKRMENESRYCSPHRVVTIDTRTRTGKESPNKAYITSRESLLKSPLQSPCGARSAQGVTHSMHHLSGGPGIQSYPQYRSASEKDRVPANRFRDQDRSFEIIPSSGSRSNLSNNMSSKQMRHRSDDFGSFSHSPHVTYWNTLASNSSVNERGKRSILDMAVIAGVRLSSLPNDGIVRHSNVENDMNSYPYKLSAGPLSPPGFPFHRTQSPISKQKY